MNIRTSEDSPIRIDFIQSAEFPKLNRLGVTFAPGKKQPNPLSGPAWDRDLVTDLVRMRDHYGIDVLLSLIEDRELEELQIPDLVEQAEKVGIRVIRFPIADMSVPEDLGAFAAVVRDVLDELDSGKHVAVHCKGGLGRAGTAAACTSIIASDLMLGIDEAMELVRKTRKGAIENDMQESFVADFQSLLKRWND